MHNLKVDRGKSHLFLFFRLLFLLRLGRHDWRQDGDATLAFLDPPAEVLPSLEAGYLGSGRLLYGNKDKVSY